MTLEASDAALTDRPQDAHARLRIGIFGGFGIGNFGNDASLEAMLHFLRAERPSAQLVAICTKPKVASDRFALEAVPLALRPRGVWRILDTVLLRQPSTWANWIYTLRTLRRFDTIVVAGTGVFDDFRDSPLGWPSRLLRWALASRLCGVRVAFVSVGAGPILNPISRLLMKWTAQLAQHRSYRDEDSRAYMSKLGVDESQSAVLPDLAFALPAPALPKRPESGPLTVGVGIMNYRGWRDEDAVYASYLQTHIDLIQWLEAQGHAVRLVIGQTPADLVAVRDIEARLSRKLMRPQDEAMASFHDAMQVLSDTDIVIASRYHVQVAALKLARPLISLSYGPKNDALMAMAGLERFRQDVHQLDFDTLKRQFNELAADRVRYVELVRTRIGAVEARLRGALRELDLLGA